jgi:hypothetical protein
MTRTQQPVRADSSLRDLLAWIAVGVASAGVALVQVRASTPWVRIATAFYLFGHVVALGLLVMGASIGWRLLARLGRWRWAAAAGAGWLFGRAVLVHDLSGLHEWLPARVRPWMVALVLALAGTLLAWLALRLAARVTRHRVAGGACLAVSLAATVVNGVILSLSYPGLHLLGVLVCGCLAAGGARWVPRAWPRVGQPLERSLFALAIVAAAVALLRAPSNEELILLLRQPGAVLAPYLARLRPALPSSQRIPADQREWFQDRSGLPPVPPSSPPLVRNPLVIMVGIDSLRADLLADPRREADLPELFRLRRESTYFSNARSPGSSTAPTYAAVFSGLYYSQQYWRLVENAGDDVYPDQDPNARFPQLLADAGITTVTVDPTGFLLNERGVVRGFVEEQTLRAKPRGYARGAPLMSAAIARLDRGSPGPLFLFLHLIDAHAPYTSAGPKPTPFEGYLAELGLVDREIGRLRQALERDQLLERTVLIVLSDHGEAFGEHGSTFHGKTLYDELLRVPLMVSVPGARPRTVTDAVSLIDLGPTVLDLMGVATPPRFMGQSLVPYLRGQHPKLTRPIVAEARLERSLVTPEGMKIIHDTRAQTVEVFDLNRDRAEERNLFGIAGDELFDALRTFFQIHTLQRPGYQVPYRKW